MNNLLYVALKNDRRESLLQVPNWRNIVIFLKTMINGRAVDSSTYALTFNECSQDQHVSEQRMFYCMENLCAVRIVLTSLAMPFVDSPFGKERVITYVHRTLEEE